MQIADTVIDFFAGQFANKYRYDLIKDPLNIKNAYSEYLPRIKFLYQEAYFWHGTGRYHYKYSGKSKYTSSFTNITYDVLKSIIKSNGLTCNHDFWTNIDSISLSNNRIYSRTYAASHQYYKTPLRYSFGGAHFWFYVLGLKLLLTFNAVRNIKRVISNSTDAKFNNNLRQWARYVCLDPTNPDISMLTFYKLRSDIVGNYGILFGIKRESVQEINYDPLVQRYESRCTKPITFEMMTHMEVPLANIRETKLLLSRNNINIPLLPLELTEIYCSTLKFNTLS